MNRAGKMIQRKKFEINLAPEIAMDILRVPCAVKSTGSVDANR
jgi:hypothetical protein